MAKKKDKVLEVLNSLKEIISNNENFCEKLSEFIAQQKHPTFKDIKAGEQFFYKGKKYTKLNEAGLAILDDFDENYQYCCFDNINNDYEKSLIRHYINNRLLEHIDIDEADLMANDEVYGDKVFLLSKEEHEEYKPLIRSFAEWWWTRSAGSSASYACYVDTFGSLYYYDVLYFNNGVRPALLFNQMALVEVKE